MNVMIFEDNHYELAYSVFKICRFGQNKVFIFCTQNIEKLFHEGWEGVVPPNTFIYTDPQYLRSPAFNQAILSVTENNLINTAFFTTISQDYLQHFQLLKQLRCHKILNLHNLNTWFRPSLFNRIVKKKRFETQQKILEQIDTISVIDPTVTVYYYDKIKYNKPVIVIPFLLFEEKYVNPTFYDETRIKIVIPGAVEAKRRDYFAAIKALKKLSPVKDRFQIVFLGKVDIIPTQPSSLLRYFVRNLFSRDLYIQLLCTLMVKRFISSYAKKGFNIKSFPSYVSQREYELEMLGAAVILSPANVYSNFEGNREIYGQTKSSGNVFDFIRYAKPGITPEVLNVQEKMASSVFRYKQSSDLALLLERFIVDSDFLQQSHSKARQNASKFGEETVRAEVLSEVAKYDPNLK